MITPLADDMRALPPGLPDTGAIDLSAAVR
jgi:hypothetical protein